MSPRLTVAARLVAVAALMLSLTAVPAAIAAQPGPAAAVAKHKTEHHKKKRKKAKRCRRGKVLVKAKHHRARCVKVKRPKRAARMPSVHSLRTDALAHLPRLRVRGHRAHGRQVRAPKLPQAMLRALAKGERAWNARGARAAQAHASLKLNGWEVDFSKVDGEYKTDKAPEGWPEVAAKPASAFVHVTSDLHVKATSHDDDGAHLVDYDVRGKDLEHLQMGLKDAHGKVLATNPPTVATMTLWADHVKPNPGGAGGRWDRDLLEHTYLTSTLTNMTDKDLQGPVVKWDLAVEALGKAYQEVEAKHWQKDCLEIEGSTAPAKLRSSQHGQVLVTGVTARGGRLKGPVPLTMTVDTGAVSPTSATWVGTPIPLDYTASATRAWEGEGVTVRGVSRMGAGTETFAFGHDRTDKIVRITSRITRDFSPYGSATYDLESEVPLQYGPGDGPPTAFGSAPLTWNAFDYHDDGEAEYCQNGETGVNDYDGTGADPGAIHVTEAFDWDPFTVSFTITPPVEHYVSTTTYPTCDPVTYTKDHTLWFNGLSVLGSLPDVKINDPASPTTWVVGGFRPGTGDVEKYRDLDVGAVHMRIAIVQSY